MKTLLKIAALLVLTAALPVFAEKDENYGSAMKLIKAKNYGAAKILLNVALEDDPTSIPVLNALARIADKEKDPKSALKYYRKIVLAQKAEGRSSKITKKARKIVSKLSPASGFVLRMSEELMHKARSAKTKDEKSLLQRSAKAIQDFALGELETTVSKGTRTRP